MRKNSLLSALLLTCTFCGQAVGQADRFGASPAEYRAISGKLRDIQADLAGLSRQTGVPAATLRAIARGQIKAFPSLSDAKLRDTIRLLAGDAAKLRKQITELRSGISKLKISKNSLTKSSQLSIEATLLKASAMLDSGELVGSSILLDEIRNDTTLAKSIGLKLWSDLIRATATLQFLSGDLDGSDRTLAVASSSLQHDATLISWQMEQERGERLRTFGEQMQDVARIAAAAKILERNALPLAQKLSDHERLKTLANLCRARLSPFAEGLTPDNWAERKAELPEITSFCDQAVGIALRDDTAPRLLRAQAYSSYGVALSLKYLMEDDLNARRSATEQIALSLALNNYSGDSYEWSSLYVVAGDICSLVNPFSVNKKAADLCLPYYAEAINKLDKAVYPSDWAAIQHRIGSTYWSLSDIDNKYANLIKAEYYFKLAISVFAKNRYRLSWARTTGSLASVQGDIGIIRNDRAAVSRSVESLNEVDAVLIDSESQGPRFLALQNHDRFLKWLAGN